MRHLILLVLLSIATLKSLAQIGVEGKIVPLRQGDKVANASDVEITGGSDVQTNLNNIGNWILNWRFNASILDGSNPGLGFLALNNAVKDDVTIISFSVQSNSDNARFTNTLTSLKVNDQIFLHERLSVNNSILYNVTGNPTLDGTKVNVPVERLLDQGGEFTDQNELNVKIWFSGETEGATLPNQFLSEIEEVDRNVYTRQETPAGQTFGIRFWLRDDPVTTLNINDPGVGLVISESNGEFADNANQFSQNTNQNQTLMYVALNSVLDFNIANLYVRVFDEDGNEAAVFNMATNFTTQPSLSALANGTIYLLTSGDRGGSFFHYFNNELIQLFTATNDPFFDIPTSNENDVDFTRTVKDLPESRLDDNLQLKINQEGIPFDDQFKLDQFVEQTSTTTSGPLTGSTQLLYRLSSFSPDTEDYFATDFDTGIPPSVGTATTWYIAAPHNYNIVSFTGIDGTTNVTPFKSNIRLTPSSVNGNQDVIYNTYTITIPDAINPTPTDLVPNGTETTITELDPTALVKINRDNVDVNFLSTIESHNQDGEIASLEGKVNTLFPLSTYVERLTDWGNIYRDAHVGQNVAIVQGYSLLADFRTTSDRFESAGVTYTAGAGVSTYTGLTDNFLRAFGFKVTAASDKVLMWLIDDSDNRIPFVDITSTGNIRINNYTPQIDDNISNQVTFLSLASGSATLTTEVPIPRAVYTIPDFPAGSSNQSQSITVDFEVLVDGSDLGAGGDISFSVPITPVNQSRIDAEHTFNLGPLHNNRLVTTTIGHRLQINGSDYQIDFTLQSAPSDITLRVNSVGLIRSYTVAASTPRVDNFIAFDELGLTHTFTGEQEFIISFQPTNNNAHIFDVVGVSVGADNVIHQFNDIRINEPEANLEDVEVPDDNEFRTFLPDHLLIHNDLVHFLQQRTIKWVYSLARLNEIIDRSVTQPVDLAAGSSVNGVAITSRTWLDAVSFTPAATSLTVTLPNSATVSDFDFIEVTWHTGVGTATDNTNRNYTEMGSMHAVVNGTDAEIILGGRGRGADNFGIEIVVPGDGTATTLTMDIINLNDAGGATLPTGSLITAVRFY